MAVIIGGLGNLPGTAAAAILLALLEGIIQSVADPTVARISSLVLMSAVLLLRPQGLFKGLTSGDDAASPSSGACWSRSRPSCSSVPWLVPALVNSFWVSVIAEILIWSLFAASVNLLFGYVGLLSFGQALYFGFGMYGVGIGIDQLRPVVLAGVRARHRRRRWRWRWCPAFSRSG